MNLRKFKRLENLDKHEDVLVNENMIEAKDNLEEVARKV